MEIAERQMHSIKLPYDARVAYLENTGNQYILTDFMSDVCPNAKFKFSIGNIQHKNWEYLCGSWIENNICGGIAIRHDINQTFQIFVGGQRYDMQYDYDAETVFDCIVRNGNFTVNGKEMVPAANYSFCKSSKPMTLFATNFEAWGYGKSYSPALGKIYSFMLSNQDDSKIDLVPVRVGDVGYMYDRVTGKLYGNSGTGAFTVGPDI